MGEQAVLVVLLLGEERGDHCGGGMVPQHHVGRWSFVAFPPPQEAAIVKHVFGERI